MGSRRNDADETDGVQNYAVLTAATVVPGGVRIQGGFTSTPNTLFQIRFFVSPSCDVSGFGEGQTQLGSIQDVSTDGRRQLGA